MNTEPQPKPNRAISRLENAFKRNERYKKDAELKLKQKEADRKNLELLRGEYDKATEFVSKYDSKNNEEKDNVNNANLKAQQNRVKIQELDLKKWKSWGTILKVIVSPITGLVKFIVRDLSPYLALIFFVFLIILLFSSYKSPKKRLDPRFSKPKKPSFLDSILPTYQFRQYANYFNTKVNSTERPKEINGRCDHIVWKQEGGSGNSGLCSRTYMPETIKWTINVDKLPELGSLPDGLYKDATANGDKLIVYIPWAVNGPFYVPQCSGAYFKIQQPDGTTKQESASNLLKDNGLTCERYVKESTSYTVQYRPKGSADLYDFATEENPKCNG